MYLPASELQQFKGFWVCPYCIMELRDEDRRMEKPPKKYPVQPLVISEVCERCGKRAEIFYIWNGRRLCKSCLDEEQKKWGLSGGGPGAAPYRVSYGEKEGILAAAIGKLLEKIGLKKKEKKSEIVAASRERVEEEKPKKKTVSSVVAFQRGRPMSEEIEKESEEQRAPTSEGLMKGKKKKKSAKKKKKKK